MGLKDKMQSGFTKGVLSSKKIFGNAARKAKELGDIGIAKVELQAIEKKQEELFISLGKKVYSILTIEGKSSISSKTIGIKELFAEISISEDEKQKKNGDLQEIQESK